MTKLIEIIESIENIKDNEGADIYQYLDWYEVSLESLNFSYEENSRVYGSIKRLKEMVTDLNPENLDFIADKVASIVRESRNIKYTTYIAPIEEKPLILSEEEKEQWRNELAQSDNAFNEAFLIEPKNQNQTQQKEESLHIADEDLLMDSRYQSATFSKK